MPLNKKQNIAKGGSRHPLPEIKDGTYFGRIVGVVDVGMQPVEDFSTGEEKPPKEKMHVIIEFPKLRMEVDGESKPRWLSKQFAVSSPTFEDGTENSYYANSNMAKILDPLLGESDDYSSLVNIPVLCGIGHTTGGNPKILNINSAPEEVNVPELENDPVVFDFYNPDIGAFNNVPKWMKTICTEALDYEGSSLEALVINDELI